MKEFTENPSVAKLNFNNLNYIPSGKNKLNLTETTLSNIRGYL